MKMKIFSLIGASAIIALVVFNAQFTNKANRESSTLSYFIAQAQAVLEEDPPGNWDAEYPECEFKIYVGIPPLVIEKTVKGSYRNCVSGTGACLWNDPFCCVRIEGICIF